MTSRLVAFLEGSGTDSQGRDLSDVWQFDDDTIDFTHDFIQWMFPLYEASGSNFTAPTLLASDIEAIQGSVQCRQNTSHNHLRVTRIIKLLRLLHSDQFADQFKQAVLAMIQEKGARINPITLAFWLES